MLALLAIIGVLPPVIGYQARDLQYLCSVGNVWSEYERIQRLGQGAHAAVYKARSKKTGTTVAVKEFRLWDYSVYQEAIREIDFMQRHRHPNLARSIECFYKPGTRELQVGMELMHGDLRNAYSVYMPEREISRILRGVLGALKYVHSFSLIHRDVRAHNVLLGENGAVKLSDFTLVVQATSSGPTNECCHPNFRAPEVTEHERFQWSRKVQTTAADIWAVGLVAVEMINGDYPKPYESYTFGTYAEDTIRSLRRRISPEFEDFIRQCLQHDVSKRPTAAKLLLHKFIRA
ncbi:P21-activated kinasepak [Aphelenchoides avenae]|nr:P21-activated kinasepak [Aphelenchus avenae]